MNVLLAVKKHWKEEEVKEKKVSGCCAWAISRYRSWQGIPLNNPQCINHLLSLILWSFYFKKANVVTEEWTCYVPLKKDYPNLRQIPSNSNKNHPDMYIHFTKRKGWLSGIHHHSSRERLQGYLNEYPFRYYRRNNMDTIFDTIIKRMIEYEPKHLNTDK